MNKQNDSDQIVVMAALVVKDSTILMMQRNDDSKRAPGKWELPNGKLQHGEEPAEGFARMLKESAAITATMGKLVGSASFLSERTRQHILIFYNMAILHNEIDLDDVKNANCYQNIDFVNVSKLQQYSVEHYSKQIAEKVIKQIKTDQDIYKQHAENTTENELVIYADGGSRGNPGPSASGYVIYNKNMELLEEGGEYLGLTTNNQAEYQAVKLALKKAQKYNAKKIHFRLDSMLVVNQLRGIYKIKSKDLYPINEDIKRIAEGYQDVSYQHVPREQNKLADQKVNEVLDSRS